MFMNKSRSQGDVYVNLPFAQHEIVDALSQLDDKGSVWQQAMLEKGNKR